MNRRQVIALLLVFLTFGASGASTTLQASCNGPGGYCSPGSTLSVTYKSGGDVIIPRGGGSYNYNRIVVSICPTSDGVYAGGGCTELKSRAISSSDYGTAAWAKYIGDVTGTFTMPRVSASQSCVTAYAASDDGANIYYYRSFGTTYRDTYKSLCASYVPPPPPPELCYVSSGNPILVDFGKVERSEISVASKGTQDVQKTLTINCMGTGNHTINVLLNMIPTSWSSSQIVTSNRSLGIGVSRDGRLLNNKDGFKMTVNGSQSTTLNFSLLRAPNTPTNEIATGAFNASGTLIVTEQ